MAAIANVRDFLPKEAPRLGFGCGDLYAGEASERLVSAALDSGIRYFDAARLYGDGQAETVLGAVLPRMRDKVVIASKAGIVPWSMRTGARVRTKAAKLLRKAGPAARALIPEPAPAAALHGAFGVAELTRSVERSLKALRTDYIDILLLHECSPAHACNGQMLSLLERLRDSGRIRAFGVATHFEDTLEIVRRAPEVARVAQFGSDMLNRNVERLPPGAADLVITHSPLKSALPVLAARPGAEPAEVGRMLLADALARNRDGLVLFSSSRPERIADAVAASHIPSSALEAFRDWAARDTPKA